MLSEITGLFGLIQSTKGKPNGTDGTADELAFDHVYNALSSHEDHAEPERDLAIPGGESDLAETVDPEPGESTEPLDSATTVAHDEATEDDPLLAFSADDPADVTTTSFAHDPDTPRVKEAEHSTDDLNGPPARQDRADESARHIEATSDGTQPLKASSEPGTRNERSNVPADAPSRVSTGPESFPETNVQSAHQTQVVTEITTNPAPAAEVPQSVRQQVAQPSSGRSPLPGHTAAAITAKPGSGRADPKSHEVSFDVAAPGGLAVPSGGVRANASVSEQKPAKKTLASPSPEPRPAERKALRSDGGVTLGPPVPSDTATPDVRRQPELVADRLATRAARLKGAQGEANAMSSTGIELPAARGTALVDSPKNVMSGTAPQDTIATSFRSPGDGQTAVRATPDPSASTGPSLSVESSGARDSTDGALNKVREAAFDGKANRVSGGGNRAQYSAAELPGPTQKDPSKGQIAGTVGERTGSEGPASNGARAQSQVATSFQKGIATDMKIELSNELAAPARTPSSGISGPIWRSTLAVERSAAAPRALVTAKAVSGIDEGALAAKPTITFPSLTADSRQKIAEPVRIPAERASVKTALANSAMSSQTGNHIGARAEPGANASAADAFAKPEGPKAQTATPSPLLGEQLGQGIRTPTGTNPRQNPASSERTANAVEIVSAGHDGSRISGAQLTAEASAIAATDTGGVAVDAAGSHGQSDKAVAIKETTGTVQNAVHPRALAQAEPRQATPAEKIVGHEPPGVSRPDSIATDLEPVPEAVGAPKHPGRTPTTQAQGVQVDPGTELPREMAAIRSRQGEMSPEGIRQTTHVEDVSISSLGKAQASHAAGGTQVVAPSEPIGRQSAEVDSRRSRTEAPIVSGIVGQMSTAPSPMNGAPVTASSNHFDGPQAMRSAPVPEALDAATEAAEVPANAPEKLPETGSQSSVKLESSLPRATTAQVSESGGTGDRPREAAKADEAEEPAPLPASASAVTATSTGEAAKSGAVPAHTPTVPTFRSSRTAPRDIYTVPTGASGMTVPNAVQSPAPTSAQPLGAAAPFLVQDDPDVKADADAFGAPFGESRTASTPAQITPHVPTRSDQSTSVARQLADAVAAGSPGSEDTIELKLNPDELGQVRFRMVQGEHGLTMNIVADRPETLDMLRRNIDQLSRYLADMGYASTGFTFGDGQAGQGQSRGQPMPTVAQTLPPVADPADIALPLSIASGGLDLRI